jgi:MFS family permease
MGASTSLGSGFRALWAGALISNVGDGIRLAALPLLATTLTPSPFLVATVTAAQYLPWLTFGPFGGALVDRWDRRRTILTTQAWRGLVMAALALVVWSGHAQIWHVCAVAFVITLGEILVDPSTFALVPTLVDDADLERANGSIARAEIVTNDFAGGPVGSTLFAFAPWLPFLVDGASYLGSRIPFARLPRRPDRVPPTQGPVPTVRADAAEGFRWLRRHPVLGPFTAAQVVHYFGFAASFSLLVVLATDELGASAPAFGILLAVHAAGAFLLGRVNVTARIFTRGTIVIGALFAGALASATSVRWSFAAGGVSQLVAAAAIWVVLVPALRE